MRRLALYIVSSIERGTRWTVLAGPQPDVVERAHDQGAGFLRTSVRRGGRAG